ncbi:MAG TPA: 2-oxo acid dehydrogenase subunit E2 [Sulfurimonas autotrophica]|uniref:Dihydrolipoamide acetyltransferase component of pyruvate dehydrogenase complex n=1 Tax=Sulfurimonas autotrophica TaxID=202747 RepID=A0A7C3G6M5_9BACT|nr:2-oxo acid dehydrogenase subunit E2 [Sulfurimonas autotrophica]
MYEIVMPQLSDSMEEGKLVSWKVSVGERVKSGDVIAEVESDKAIMEVQTFKDGIVKELLVKEDDEVKIGTVIARIETGATASSDQKQAATKPTIVPKEERITKKQEVNKEDTKPNAAQTKSVAVTPKESIEPTHISHKIQSGISPKARAKAAALGVDVAKIQARMPQKVLHAEDVDKYVTEKYFTPKALKLLQEYQLESSFFELNHKIDSDEVQAYIDANEIALPKPLSPMQKAIIANVTRSAQKPIYHIYESIDAKLFEAHQEHSITAWLVKIFAKVMMQHESFRSQLLDNAISIAPNASLSIAVADNKNLYMPVIKDASKLTIFEISEQLAAFKEKLKTNSFTTQDMQGGTFGISNLGMLGVARFDAMINKDESGIVAVGGIKDGQISVTLTADHRVINGYEAALFMRDIKKEASEPLNFKE